MRKRVCLFGVAAAAALSVGLASSASAAGAAKATDFNGDNYRDLVIGAPGAYTDDSAAATAYLVYGGDSGLATSHHQAKNFAAASNGQGDESLALTGADFDGDGHADLVVGNGSATSGGVADVGAVTVVNGTASGATGAKTVFRPGVAGVPGTADTHVGFGTDVVAGDFDGDGHTDLAIGGWDGSVTVLYGSANGLTTAGARRIADDTYPKEYYDGALASCDLDNDGRSDLVASGMLSDGEGDESPAVDDFVFAGSDSGLPAAPSRTVSAGYGFRVGDVACGDVNADGYGDLVDTPLFEGEDGPVEPIVGGQIQVHYGSADLIGTKTTTLSQASSGVPGAPEEGDEFGSALAVGDVNHDHIADVAVGVAGEAIGSKVGAGAVDVLYGAKAGPSGNGAQTITQDTSGIPGTAEAHDTLGSSVALVDFDADGTWELVAGVPGENDDTGAVTVVRATRSGLSHSGALTFGPKTLGSTATGTRFGADLVH